MRVKKTSNLEGATLERSPSFSKRKGLKRILKTKSYPRKLLARRLKTIAGKILRDITRKLPQEALDNYQETLSNFQKVCNQERKDKNKIYSLHEPDVYRISKVNRF